MQIEGEGERGRERERDRRRGAVSRCEKIFERVFSFFCLKKVVDPTVIHNS